MHAMWFASSSLHFPSASDGSYRRKQSSRARLVSGHAQHLDLHILIILTRFLGV